MEMKSVFSSHVNAIGYDEQNKELHVEFNSGDPGKPNKTAIYYGVPPDVAASVTNAPSIGKALHSFVRDQYRHVYK